ncbi:MAG: Xaa-Pro peptidase family protein [Candidatus Woesearchaeota archaeon]
MRIEKFQEVLLKKNIDIAVFFSFDELFNKNVYYFTGYKGLGLFSILKNNSFLIAPEMEYEKAKKIFKKSYKSDNKKRIFEIFFDLINNMLNKENNKEKIKIGIEMSNINLLLFKNIKKYFKRYNNIYFVDITKDVEYLRLIKDKNEIEKIKFACNITDYVFEKICKNFNFKSEKELKRFIEFEIKKKDCELAFEPIVASGKNSSMPHYNNEKDCKIKKGFLLLDFGAKYKEYCSDMTRMLYIGKPSKKEIYNYNLVLKTLIQCENFVLKNNSVSKIYEKSLNVLDKYQKYFSHSLGHGLGLDIHEKPSLSKEDKSKLKRNMVFTIEPGIYFENRYGIRIEDTLVYEKNKIEILTKSKKELVILR